MYGGMYGGTHSAGRKISRQAVTRTQHGQTARTTNQNQTNDKAIPSYSKKLANFFRETWYGITETTQDSELEEIDGHNVHYKPEAIDTLCQITKFNKRELQLIYRGFKQEAPSGVVREENFKVIYAQFFPKGADTNQYAHYVFNTFDPDHTGSITFTDFVIGLSVLARGSIQDKLRWTFSLYDINGDGIITKDELSRIIGSIYDLMGKSVEPIVEESTAKEHVDKLFEKLDFNNDGVVTVDEFIDYCMNDESIKNSLEVFNTIL